MIWIGVLLGLAAATLQSFCYIVSGSYVRRTGRAGWTLTAPQRALMLIPYGALTVATWPESFAGEGLPFLAGAATCMVMAYLGDVGLFQMQKTVEPSRVAPLQAMKIPLIALISWAVLGRVYSGGQVLGILLVVASAGILCGAGQRIGRSAWLWLLVCSGGFAVSDIGVGCALAHSREMCGGLLRSSLFALGVTGLGSSVLALPVVAAQKASGTLPTLRECLRYALPFGTLWIVAMVFLFVCFSLSGIVLGTIAQSTRGLISVAVGWFLAHHGFADLERGVSVAVFIRRAVAAILIIGAMVLYASC